MQAEPKTEWSDQDNLHQAQILKGQGNEHFKNKSFKEALRSYHKAMLHLAGIITEGNPFTTMAKPLAPETIRQQAQDLKFSIFMNMAQIYILQDKHEKGLEVLSKAGKIKTNPKFYYRRAICLMKVSEFEQAKADISQLMETDTSMRKEGENLLSQLQSLERQQDSKSKAMFQKFFK